MRRLLVVPRVAVRLLATAAACIVVGFFVFTQTQVGREELRRQLEAGFARQFHGRLSIGRLSGNLVGTLDAERIALLGPSGDTVAVARRVVARPRWVLGLLANEVELRELWIDGLRVHAVRDTSGRWNVEDVFRPRRPRTTAPVANRPPRFRLGHPRLVLREGRLRLEDRTPRPGLVADGKVFDALNARYTSLDATLQLVRREGALWVDLERLDGWLPDYDLGIDRLAARLRLTDSTRTVYDASLDAGGTRLRADAMALSDRTFRFDVRGAVDFGALRRLVPALPLASTAQIDLAGAVRRDTAAGTFDAALHLVRLRAEGVDVDASGTVAQSPDSLRLALDALDASATADGLAALVPRLASARALAPGVGIDLGATTVAAARGGGGLRLATQGTLRHGDGTVVIDRLVVDRAAGGMVRWDARLAADAFALARYLPRAAPTVVSGTLDTRGDATPLRADGLAVGGWTVRAADARLRLGPSTVEGRRLDSLRLDLAIAGTAVRARGRVAPTGAGSATFDLAAVPSFDRRTAHAVRGTLGFRSFDASSLAGRPGFVTRITGTADVDVRGTGLADLSGTADLVLDDALVTLGAETVSARRTRATLSGAARGAFVLDLDLGEGRGQVRGTSVAVRGTTARLARTADGALALDVRLDDGAATVQNTPLALRGTTARLRRGADGALALEAATPLGTVDLRGVGDLAALRAAADAYRPRLAAYLNSRLPAYGDTLAPALLPPLRLLGRPVQVSGTGRLLDTALVRRLVPGLGGSGVRVAFDVAAGAGRVRARADLDADSLGHPRARARSVRAALALDDDGTLRMSVGATAQRVAAGAFRADDARLAAAADGDRLSVRFDGLRRFGQEAAAPAPVDDLRRSDALAEGDLDLRALDQGALARAAARPDTAGLAPPDTLRLDLVADRLAGRLRVALRAFSFGAGPLRLAARPAAFDAYRDAVVFGEPVVLTGAAVAGTPQVLRLSGIASARPEHRLRVDAERVALATLLAATPLRQRLLGTVDARLVVAAALARPDATGDVTVADLALQPVVNGVAAGAPTPLGTLDVQADYVQGDSTGQVTMRLRRSGTSRSEATGEGTFRLPDGPHPGSIDFTADLARIDASVLDALVPALFARTTGDAHGLLTVQGDLRRPDYAADLVVDSVRSTLPLLGTAATATGFVRLTPKGIALRQIRTVDPTGGTLLINGSLDGPVGRPPLVNLTLTMDAFRLIDLPAATDFPIYGQVWLSGTGTLKGRPDALRITARGVEASPRSSVFIPLRAETTTSVAPGYITFLDTLGLGRTDRPRRFNAAAGLVLDLDVRAPSGTGFNLAFDPLVGDVMRAKGAGRLQLRLDEGVFQMFGDVNIEGGDYLFTAGDVFVRRFALDGGTLTFDGAPTDARLDVRASYRTRASLAGLPIATDDAPPVPLVVRLDVTERLSAPRVALTLALDRSRDARASAAVEGFEALVNQPERQAEYATSVLLTNSFLLTSQAAEQAGLAQSGNRLAFASLSQLVATQLNRYLADVLPGIELTLGFQDTQTSALDVTYGVALRLLDDRLTLRGEGVLSTDTQQSARDVLRGEFVVEVRLGPTVSAEVFYRRDNDLYESVASGTLTSTTGASLSYRTRFTSWRQFWGRLF